MNALRELLAIFDIKVDDSPIKKADKAIDNFKSTLRTMGTIIAGAFAFHEVEEFVKSAIELGAETDDMSQRLGIATDELESFQYAVKLSGGSIEDANNALRFFEKNLGEAQAKGGDAAAIFTKLGVSITDKNGQVGETADLLAGVAEGFSQLKTDGERTTVAMQLFGRGGAAIIPLLKQGKAGVEKLGAEFKALGGGLDASTIESLAKADDELDRVALASKYLKAELVSSLVPALSVLVGWVSGLVGWFREFSKHSYIVQTSMATLAAITGVLALIWAALNIEILLVVLGIALLILAVDDLYTWLEGGDSIIGRFLDSLFGEGKSDELLKEIKADYEDIKKSVEDAGGAVSDMVDAISDLAGAVDIDLGGAAKSVFGFILGQIRILANEIKTVAKVIQWVAEKGKDVAGITNQLGEAVHGRGPFATLAAAAGISPVLPPNMQHSVNNANSTVTQHNDVKVDVTTTGDGSTVGKDVGNGISDALLNLRGAFAGAAGG